MLAGYLKLVPPPVIAAYRGRIINITRPAARVRGQGMYGRRVHEAVLASGARESGATVHLVDEVYDRGEVLAQARVPVLPDDTPERLAARVLEVEHGCSRRWCSRRPGPAIRSHSQNRGVHFVIVLACPAR